MTEGYVCYAKAEDELNAIRRIDDWHITNAAALLSALHSLDGALQALVDSKSSWQGAAGDAARTRVAQMRSDFASIAGHVDTIVKAIDSANSARRNVLNGTELPSAQVDPFWANAVKTASVIVHPVLGELAADTALSVISNFLGDQREADARKAVDAVRTAMVEPTQQIAAARQQMAYESPTILGGSGSGGPDGTGVSGSGGPGGYPGAPGYPGYPGGSGGVGSHRAPIWTEAPLVPGYPGHPGDPGYPGGGHPGGGYPGGRVTVDDPNLRGHVPGSGGDGGSAGSGHGHGGGLLPGGLGGGALGGGAAAALAFAARGKLTGVGGAGASLSGVQPGGLLGSGGAGGSGVVTTPGQAGATGMGSRGGMVGGQGQGGSEEEKRRRASAGPTAPHLEDDEAPIPMSQSARAGSRDERA
ncbi:hypothetical protein [Microbacterium capsulatum]|uniref:PPE family domain-containing protein n=1 Tax=Microbacterium capsulatum TaxID=3041921 RepID=A0ABU0XJH3_9MICO|nr:hypothetical protein [Microbacterium sp. ASV81]MDQ4215262.1 hypothetical protein [Microbacterium sp. ASV81]